jgi:Mn-dependent DtxR family transcriptional regulator
VSIPSEPPRFTELQGQYLAFIYAYSRIHRRAPAEADMQRFFGTSPPTVHRMVLELERLGLIRRSAGQARSIELLVRPEALPILR